MYFAFDQKDVEISECDKIEWTWNTAFYVKDAKHGIYQVVSETNNTKVPGGVDSGPQTRTGIDDMSHVMRLWSFSSSIKSFFKNAHAQPSSGARCLIFSWTLRLLPFFRCANSEDYGETAGMRKLT